MLSEINHYVKFQNDAEAVGAERHYARDRDEQCRYDEALRGHLSRRLVLVVFGTRQKRVDNDVPCYEALDRSRQQNGQAEQQPRHIHQMIVAAVVLQQVA